MNTDFTMLHYDDVKHHTERAVLFIVGDDEVWVPKSVIEVEYDDREWEVLTAYENPTKSKEIG
jgi:hypothetical protein